MKLPIKWLKTYADFTATPHEFAERMTMSGSKVEKWESEADSMENVVIGKVIKLERHQNSDHLWICQVDVGSEVLQIVTGAQNLKEGDLCPVALHGAKLPNGTEIRRGKLRGEESCGMLCSLPELLLSENDFPHATADGILVLDEDAPLGSDAATALGMDDVVVEFEITPNRPDCLSVRGLAREVGATFEVPFTAQPPVMPGGEGDVGEHLAVKVEATDTCMRYSAAMVKNVRIKPSPKWMRERLRGAGVRPINNIVDITNYVMLEYGQPMHAFDYAYVNGGRITVRNAKDGEEIVTLDGITRKLDTDMMVIADEKGPIALAGIMGGEYSGVYDSTNMVVFEVAAFDGPSVRATSRRLMLRTESSTRFEKGLDPNLASDAMARALQLVAELDAGDIIGGALDDYAAPRTARTIPFEPQEISRLLGVDIPKADMIKILEPLEITVQDDLVHLPTYRDDIALSCDIAEELARFTGYNNLPSTLLHGSASARPTERQEFDGLCVDTLIGCGFWQCQTFSFYSPKELDMIALAENDTLRNVVRISNPLGEETSIMRTTALPSIMQVAARNWASRAESCAVFERATEYLPTEDDAALPHEQTQLVFAAYGEGWDYFGIKGVVQQLLSTARITNWNVQPNTARSSFHPGRCADIFVTLPAQGEQPPKTVLLGHLGEVHPDVCANYDIKTKVVAASLSQDVLFAARGGTPQFVHLPKFPAITRDLALVADNATPAASIEATIRAAGGKRLESISLFDVYTGDNIEKGKKSLAYSLVMRSADSTLTDADADTAVKKILAALEAMDVVLRS